MLVQWLATPAVALDLAGRLAAICLALSSLEWLANAADLRASGTLAWPIAQLTLPPAARRGLVGGALHWFGAYPRTIGVLVARLACALAIVLTPADAGVRGWAAALIVVCSLLIQWRMPFGSDGAQPLATFTLAAVAVASATRSEAALSVALWLIAVQACAAYLASGLAKAFAARWRSGSALTGVLSTLTYGCPRLGGWLADHPNVARLASWSVIAGECAVPAVLFVPVPFGLGILTFGLAFHCAVAVLMGLGGFVWAFAAAYPALLYCAATVSTLLG